MKLAVVGSRSFNDANLLDDTISRFLRAEEHCFNSQFDFADFYIISGGADGADTLAEKWAKTNLYRPNLFIKIQPDYNKYPPKIAPLERNTEIVKLADKIIAFHDGQSTGTLDVISKALTYNKPIIIVPFRGQ